MRRPRTRGDWVPDAHGMLELSWDTTHNSDKPSSCSPIDENARIKAVGGKEIIAIEILRARRQLRIVRINDSPKASTLGMTTRGAMFTTPTRLQPCVAMQRTRLPTRGPWRASAWSTFSGESVYTYRRSYNLHHNYGAWSKLPIDG